MFVLIDNNNFFVSCERVFNPSLEGKPVIVLSSNDGCIIARSQEAKALGVPMGIPLFKVSSLIESHKVQVYSSNFALYADFSRRVINILEELAEHVEVYSVDESFIHFKERTPLEDLLRWSLHTRSTILQWLGLPTRIGIGPTKTLAKLANTWAKQFKEGICYVDQHHTDILKQTPIETVWGIGRRLSSRLHNHGVLTAFDFIHKSDSWIKRHYTIMGLRTAHELRGIPCLDLGESENTQKSLVVSRSFAQTTTEFETLYTYVSLLASRAAEKLRTRNLMAHEITLFIRTSPFRDKFYSQSACLRMPHPTNDTRMFLDCAHRVLHRIFKIGFSYKKAGICLLDLTPSQAPHQMSLFHVNHKENISSKPLMDTMDSLNKKYGTKTVGFGKCGLTQSTDVNITKREKLSPPYTTSWKHLKTVS